MPDRKRATFRQADVTKAARAVRAAGIQTFDLVCSPQGLIIRVAADQASAADRDVSAELSEWSRRGS